MDEWHEWEIRHGAELDRIVELRESGHSRHCACRMVWGGRGVQLQEGCRAG